MFALPIIERELRVRARKPWTTWTRVVVALLVSLIAVSTLSWVQPRGWGAGTWQPGKDLFDRLSVLVFLLCLVEGVRQTADCLSQEKREGTLGLLLLTDLSGFEIVLGKLAATSLGSFYMLLAVFPAMAIALPAGGLTAGEFWRTQCVLLNTLFLSVAAGIWASSRQREENRSLTTGLVLVGVLALVPWMFDGLLRILGLPNVSPCAAFDLADDADYRANAGHFWFTLAAMHALAWWLLVAAGRKVQMGWRDEPTPAAAVPPPDASITRLFVNQLARARRLALTTNPAAWLADRMPTHRGLIWIAIVLLTFAVVSPWMLFRFGPRPNVGLGMGLQWAGMLVPLLLLSFVAARVFADARREGTLELLLSTPLSPVALVDAHWRALWRQVAPPFWLAWSIAAFLAGMGILTAGAAFGIRGVPYSYLHYLQVIPFADRMLRAFAVCWLGLYLGLRMRSTTQAMGFSLLFTVAAPAVGSYLIWFMMRPITLRSYALGPPPAFFWIVSYFPTAMSVLYSALLAAWARRRLLTRFRELAAGG